MYIVLLANWEHCADRVMWGPNHQRIVNLFYVSVSDDLSIVVRQ